jgi:hypothetical protein
MAISSPMTILAGSGSSSEGASDELRKLCECE